MKWKVPGLGDNQGKRSGDASSRQPSGAGKTTYVGRPRSDDETTGKPAGGVRGGSQRLQWPARDEGQPKKVQYYSAGSDNSDRPQLHDPSKAGTAKPASVNDPVAGWLVVVEGPGKG